ncbi:MAG: hypothetical protein JXE07_07020 [Candidatus Aminicenantes bacterium]|nr:hypothetical protein [Candidatus Aminicenantes bacterium]
MKKATLVVALSFLAFALNPVWASGEIRPFPKGSMFLTGQFGLNSMVRTADPLADPFNSLPFPLGASFEFMLTENIGLGGTAMYDRWSDYLGMYGGKWTFRLIRPSFDCAYHFSPERVKGLGFYTGIQFGYTFVDVDNRLSNRYNGLLKSEAYLAPFAGVHFNPWPNSQGFLGRLSVNFKAAWSVTGRFTGVYGLAGLTYRLK